MCSLKVVHICTFTAGGAGTAANRLHNALIESGVDSYFMSTDAIPGKNIISTIPKQKKRKMLLHWIN